MSSALPPRDALPSGGPLEENVRDAMAIGELVPSEIVDRLLQERLEQLGPQRGLVLDGYPRTPQQAGTLRGMLARLERLERRPVVLWLQAPREELLRRLRHRAAHLLTEKILNTLRERAAAGCGATSVRERPMLAGSSRRPNSGSMTWAAVRVRDELPPAS